MAAGLLSPSQLPVLTMAAQSLKDQGKGAWPAVPGEAPVGGWGGAQAHGKGPSSHLPPRLQETRRKDPTRSLRWWHLPERGRPSPAFLCYRKKRGRWGWGAWGSLRPPPRRVCTRLAGTASLSPSVRVPFSLCVSLSLAPSPIGGSEPGLTALGSSWLRCPLTLTPRTWCLLPGASTGGRAM